MTPLKIVDHLPSLTGGRDAIMGKARELWVENSGARVNASASVRVRMAVETILRAVKALMREPLAALIDSRVQAVEDEFVLLEGEPPADGDTPDVALCWWRDLYEEQNALLAEVAGIVGREAVDCWVRNDAPGAALADLILAKPIDDAANALTLCDIKQADIAELAGWESDLTPVSEAPASPTPSKRGRKPGSVLTQVGAVTEAAKGLLAALYEPVVGGDAPIAEAIGVSRAQAYNYRKGVTPWRPTDEQRERLKALVETAANRLTTAYDALTAALETEKEQA